MPVSPSEFSRPRHIWRAIYPLLMFWLISDALFFAVNFGFTFFLGVGEMMGGAVSGEWFFNTLLDEKWSDFFWDYGWWIDLIVSVIATAVFAAMWQGTKRGREDGSGGGGLTFEHICLIAVASVGAQIYFSYFDPFYFLMDYFPEYEEIAEGYASGSLASRILAIGIAGPIGEELCFRGVIQKRLSSWLPMWGAVLFQCALFGIFHQNGYQALYTFAVGLLLTLVYIRFKTLLAPMIAHMAFNLSSIFLDEVYYWISSEDLTVMELVFPEIAILPILAAAGFCVWCIVKRREK